MRTFIFFCLFCSFTLLGQKSDSSQPILVWDSTQIISLELNNTLLHYKAVLARGRNSFVKTEIKLDSIFSPINSFLSREMQESLSVEFPFYQVKIDGNYGYSSGYRLNYKGEEITIYRDCSCGFSKGVRVSGRRIRVMSNHFFTKRTSLYLHYRNPVINDYDFKYSLDEGLPVTFISYQDTNKVHKAVLFKNGKIDSIKSFYPNGELEYEATLKEGGLNGIFTFYTDFGSEKLKVYFEKNRIKYFENNLGKYEWNDKLEDWMLD